MMLLINEYLSFFDDSPFLYTLAALALLIAISWILNFIVKKVLLRLVRRALKLSPIPDVAAKVEKWRNNAAANLLLKRGYSVIDPDGKPCTLKEGAADA